MKKENILLVLLASINFTHILDFMIMMPLGNYLMSYFQITPQQFTLLVAAYTLSAGASGFVSAFFAWFLPGLILRGIYLKKRANV